MRKRLFVFLLAAMMLLPLWGSADILGREVSEETTTLDLTKQKQLTAQEVDLLIEQLAQHPQIGTVDLMNVTIQTADKIRLVQGCPQVFFLWKHKVGRTVYDSNSTAISLDADRSEATLDELAAALTILPNVEYVSMMRMTKYSLSEVQESLIVPFPDVQFDFCMVFRTEARRYSIRTDCTAFSTLKGKQEPRFTSEELMDFLQYCPDLLGIDAGHNNVHDLNFLLNWPKLRWLIIVDSKEPLTDISPLADLPDLEYVELFMQGITDLSPLAGHVNLLDLNLCYNDITDLSPLYSCTNLKRLWISNNPNLTVEEIEAFKAQVPGCYVEYKCHGSTDKGWRETRRARTVINGFEGGKYKLFQESAPLE